jgi:LmbE family N-acetylglucosaminyl deacetylase
VAKTILAVGAHCDDCEIGAGGVLIQAARAGCRVVIVTIVSDHSSWALTKGREAEARASLEAVARKYGFEKRYLEYPYHVIDGGDVELKRRLSKIYWELKPETALIHHTEDHFPDHVAAGQAAHDAFLFPHGLAGDLKAERIKRIMAFTITPWQTYHFEADAYFDVGDVMPEYMELLNDVDSAYFGNSPESAMHYEVRDVRNGRVIRLGAHARTKYADCISHGSRAGCEYAIGFRQVWGKRWGEKMF